MRNKQDPWLFDHAAPLWAEKGWHPDGLFAEQLDMAAARTAGPRRLRVQARQIYAFCTLGRLGWSGPWRERVTGALGTLLGPGRRDDGFFIHAFSDDGRPADPRADLYDHAFALFSLGHAADVLGREDLLDAAAQVTDLIEAHWRHPQGGFREGEIDGPPRRAENPHMHMLEAALALWHASGADRWKTFADEIALLCRNRFTDRATGAIREYFADDWTPVPGETGLIAEPGHCLEWAWLFEALGGPANLRQSEALVAFARSHGLSNGGMVTVAEVYLDGRVRNPGTRVWPQTERLKAALARFRRTRDEAEAADAMSAFQGLMLHLQTPLPGLWRERWHPATGWEQGPAPASSFYHIVCAIAELLETCRVIHDPGGVSG